MVTSGMAFLRGGSVAFCLYILATIVVMLRSGSVHINLINLGVICVFGGLVGMRINRHFVERTLEHEGKGDDKGSPNSGE